MKLAVLSMDVEDWFHLDYFPRDACDATQSLLDGIDVYENLLATEGVVSTFFVLGELAASLVPRMGQHAKSGNEIASHGWDHRRPLMLGLTEFQEDVRRAKNELESLLGSRVYGYRAPCFSLDRSRLDILRLEGYTYDSSRIETAVHPLYGKLDLAGFSQVRPWVFYDNGFTAFEVSTLKLGKLSVPISGGGYIRLLPWWLMKGMLSKYLSRESFYTLYIHPFELSPQPDPVLPLSTGFSTRLRFSRNRTLVPQRLRQVIRLLKSKGYRFTTFSGVCNELGLLP